MGRKQIVVAVTLVVLGVIHLLDSSKTLPKGRRESLADTSTEEPEPASTLPEPRLNAPEPVQPITVQPIQAATAVEEEFYIIDVTMYNGEAIMETRLELLYDVVDYFYIQESNISFAGKFFKPEGLWKDRNAEQFRPYQDKIKWITSYADDEKMKRKNNVWGRETLQRFEFIKQARIDFPEQMVDNVIAIQGDVDELVDPEVVKQFRPGGLWHETVISKRSNLVMKFFYYNFKHYLGDWSKAIVGPARDALYNEAVMMSARDKVPSTIPDAGWHGSYMMSIERIQAKLKSFSHQEYNKEPFINLSYIRDCVENGRNLFKKNTFARFDPMQLPKPLQSLHKRICKEQNVTSTWEEEDNRRRRRRRLRRLI